MIMLLLESLLSTNYLIKNYKKFPIKIDLYQKKI